MMPPSLRDSVTVSMPSPSSLLLPQPLHRRKAFPLNPLQQAYMAQHSAGSFDACSRSIMQARERGSCSGLGPSKREPKRGLMDVTASALALLEE